MHSDKVSQIRYASSMGKGLPRGAFVLMSLFAFTDLEAFLQVMIMGRAEWGSWSGVPSAIEGQQKY